MCLSSLQQDNDQGVIIITQMFFQAWISGKINTVSGFRIRVLK